MGVFEVLLVLLVVFLLVRHFAVGARGPVPSGRLPNPRADQQLVSANDNSFGNFMLMQELNSATSSPTDISQPTDQPACHDSSASSDPSCGEPCPSDPSGNDPCPSDSSPANCCAPAPDPGYSGDSSSFGCDTSGSSGFDSSGSSSSF